MADALENARDGTDEVACEPDLCRSKTRSCLFTALRRGWTPPQAVDLLSRSRSRHEHPQML